MSLKAFHLVFIIAAVLLSLGFAAWEFRSWYVHRQTLDLVLGSVSAVAGILLIAYGRYFLRKFKNVSYL